MENKPKYRIGNVAIVILVGLAGLADLLSLIPLVGDITGPLFWILASAYLWKAGCGLVNGRRLGTELISMIAEMIPVVQEFPLTLAGIIVVIAMVRTEDRAAMKVSSGKSNEQTEAQLNQAGIRLPTSSAEPLNEAGIRAPNGGFKLAA